MSAIFEKTLNCEVRNEIVRDLVTHVYSYIEKPTSAFVESVAKKLVDKYSFMGDFGNMPHVSSGYWYLIICNSHGNSHAFML